MLKYLFILFFMLAGAAVFAQKKSVINLISSESVSNVKINGVDVNKVYKGTFQQEYSVLSSDSAYIYPKTNTFDAFGHVVITQGDTLHVYADKLNYDANTKIAILTDHVRMVDKDATLTTNYFTYNTATRIGTYTGGGKLVNKDNTLISKNGYYFAFSRDSYFRYDVVLTTPDALIKTDTLRYNTGTRISYFYGPTNIYGTKDKDTLYTENGLYNTKVEQAAFGKNNLYKSGTKSLKGDSLFYDKLKGYGRAVKHITFTDTEQKMTIKGDLGEYYKAGEKTIVTQNPYVVLVTEEKDTTKTDTATKIITPVKTTKPALSPPKNTMPLVTAGTHKPLTDSALVAVAVSKNGAKVMDQLKNGTSAVAVTKADSATIKAAISNGAALAAAPPKKQEAVPKPLHDSTLVKSGLTNKAGISPAKNSKPVISKTKKAKVMVDSASLKNKTLALKDTVKIRIKRDSIYMTADTLETRMTTYKDWLDLAEQRRKASIIDTSIKVKTPVVVEKPSKFLSARKPVLGGDSSYLHRALPVIKLAGAAVKDTAAIRKAMLAAAKRRHIADSLAARARSLDPVYARSRVVLSDTARIRVLEAHHNAKLFKSDLQAKADSMFYTSADSTIRLYVRPMIWTQGSQLSGDTIYLQMKDKKMDNMDMFLNSFIVSLDKGDSAHFNQVGGKRMRGYFKDSKLSRMYIDGNAESIYYKRDSGKVSGLDHSVSGRIYVAFKNSEASLAALLFKAEVNYSPIDKVKEDDKILKGFIWKPRDRPASKEAIIHPQKDKPVPKKPTGKTLPGIKPPDKGNKTTPAARDSTNKAAPGKDMPELKTGKDTVARSAPPKSMPANKATKDTVMKRDPAKVEP